MDWPGTAIAAYGNTDTHIHKCVVIFFSFDKMSKVCGSKRADRAAQVHELWLQ